jgi:hypothetical protein
MSKRLTQNILCFFVLLASLLVTAQGMPVLRDQERKTGPYRLSILTAIDPSTKREKYALNEDEIFLEGWTLSKDIFLISYQSKEIDEKNAAYAFLLGVTDATEGKIWCSHTDYHPDKILNTIDKELKSMRHADDVRVASAVIDALRGKYSCKKKSISSSSFIKNGFAQKTKGNALQQSILTEKKYSGQKLIKQGRELFSPNLSFKNFLTSFNSKNQKERNVAYAFLLGVFESVEKKPCCRKWQSKLTLLENIHHDMLRLNAPYYDERAAYVITGIIENRCSCKKEH